MNGSVRDQDAQYCRGARMRSAVVVGLVVVAVAAALWFPASDALAQDLISNVVPGLEVTTFWVGTVYYGDRDYTIISMPSELVGAAGIKTLNDEKTNSTDNYVQFDLGHDADVYIAYDNRAISLPNWMSDYTATGTSIGVTDEGATPLQLYMKTFDAGLVVLGGNMATGAVGANTNYMVLVVPLPDPAVHVVAPRFIELGERLTMTAIVSHLEGEIEYQWSKVGVGDLPGEDGPSMTVDTVDESHEGSYQVEVWVGAGDRIESAPRFVEVVPVGSMPVAGAVGLGLLIGACVFAGAAAVRRKNR